MYRKGRKGDEGAGLYAALTLDDADPRCISQNTTMMKRWIAGEKKKKNKRKTKRTREEKERKEGTRINDQGQIFIWILRVYARLLNNSPTFLLCVQFQ